MARESISAAVKDASDLFSCVAGFVVGVAAVAIALLTFIHRRGEYTFSHNPSIPGHERYIKPVDVPIRDMKTGDLVALSYNGVRTQFSKLSYDSVFTHVCMVYIEPSTGEPFILEAAAYDAPYDCSVVRIPYLAWARINRASRAVLWIPINKPLPTKAVSRAFERFERLDVGVEGLKPSWFRFLEPPKTPETVDPTSLFASPKRVVRPKHPERTTTNPILDLADALPVPECIKPRSMGINGDTFEYTLACHELVLDVLQKTGAMRADYTPCSYTPRQVVRRELPMIGGYAYGDPVSMSLWASFKESRL